MNRLISVIIPVLNRQDEIEECIRSVYGQSYENWEILIIDSGSTDRTPEICRNLASKEPRIKLLTSERGVSAARNKGLEAAHGDYLFFLDSDDVIHPSLLRVLVEAMEKHNASIGGSGIVNVLQSDWKSFIDKAPDDRSPGQTKYVTNAQALNAVFRHITPINLIGGVMMRRDLIGETRFSTKLHIGEDFYFVYLNLIKNANVVFLKERWYYARIHNSNISLDYSYQGFLSRFERRRLVWISEEAHERKDNAELQKEDALDVYVRCLKQNKKINQDTKQMQTTMKAHRKDVLPYLSLKHKLLYTLSVYLPGIYLLFNK